MLGGADPFATNGHQVAREERADPLDLVTYVGPVGRGDCVDGRVDGFLQLKLVRLQLSGKTRTSRLIYHLSC